MSVHSVNRLGNALEDLQALGGLEKHPGWSVFLRKHTEQFAGLTAECLNLKTAASDAEVLRQARGRIERDFDPAKLLENLLVKLRAEAETELRRRPAA